VAILATAPVVARNSDTDYPYRHDSAFYYLTGFTEPDAVLVLVAPKAHVRARAILFCRAKNVERETWEGFHFGPEAARTAFGFDKAYPVDELDTVMAQLLADAPALYYALGHSAALDAQVAQWLKAVRAQARAGVAAPAIAHDLASMIDAMRVIKDASEQATMLRAATISGQAHARAMRAARPGMFEYALEAELLYEFRRNGAQAPAYPSIVIRRLRVGQLRVRHHPHLPRQRPLYRTPAPAVRTGARCAGCGAGGSRAGPALQRHP
jgi:Xaa-Pro aminopeptidase